MRRPALSRYAECEAILFRSDKKRWNKTILFINTLGNTGVTLFILISGYFGIRFNTHKFFKMLVTGVEGIS